MEASLDDLKSELRSIVGAADIVESGESLETLSKDYYWYSPCSSASSRRSAPTWLSAPGAWTSCSAVVAACSRARVPVVPRGAGTGNYGQCVPLYGGVVIDFSRLDKILSLEGGVARVQAGARLGTIESEARKVGWELRCMPSTWMKSTMGGFSAGAPGGSARSPGVASTPRAT